jgi:hypothetical protein
MPGCDICANNYTGTLRKPIECNYCQFKCCLKCFKTYITNKATALKCMSCKNTFEMDFLQEQLSKQYFNTVIRKLERDIIFEQEKKYLINTQRELDLKKKQVWMKMSINTEKEKLSKFVKDDDDLGYALQESLIFELENEIKNLSFNYIKKCGNIQCNGMLSDENTIDDNYLCTICFSTTCKDCEVVLIENSQKRASEEHICDKNILENLKTLKEETKPCPTCLARIYKTEGCDQMYCVSCFTVFDWKSGVIDIGKIHNPEYFKRLKHYNRNPLDIQCGRELDTDMWANPEHKYYKLVKDPKFINYFCSIANSVAYISKQIKEVKNETSINRDIRIQFLNGKMKETRYKILCSENINIAKKKNKMLDIVITFMNCGNEIFFRVFHHWDNVSKDLDDVEYHNFKKELDDFTSLCNDEFNKISIITKDLFKLRFGINHF